MVKSRSVSTVYLRTLHIVWSLVRRRVTRRLTRLQTMYNVLKFSEKWWNHVKDQFTGTATQSQGNRKFCQFNKDQYCMSRYNSRLNTGYRASCPYYIAGSLVAFSLTKIQYMSSVKTHLSSGNYLYKLNALGNFIQFKLIPNSSRTCYEV